MTPAAFRRKAETAFRAANPDAASATIIWSPIRRWTTKTTPFKPGMSGNFQVEAAGYRSRTMLATMVEGEGMMVR